MAYNLIGKNFVPTDVVAKVTGRAKYAEDFRADGMVFCKSLTSPIPHAKIRRIDTSAALKFTSTYWLLIVCWMRSIGLRSARTTPTPGCTSTKIFWKSTTTISENKPAPITRRRK